MTIRTVSVLLVASVLTQVPAGAPPADVKKAAERITAEGLRRDLDYLASDELKGRNTPSPGFDQAAGFITARLGKAGLAPTGDNGTYLQRYTMRESEIDVAAASVEIDGRRFAFGDDFVLRSFAKPVNGTFPVVYVGHGWTVPGKQIDPFAGVDVKGKVVLAHGPRALPKGVDIPLIGRINIGATTVFAEAERRGAVAVIFIAQASAMTGWAALRTQNTTVRELAPIVPSAYAAIPITGLMITPQAAEALMAGERVDGASLVAGAEKQDYPPSFQLAKPISLNVTATHDRAPALQRRRGAEGERPEAVGGARRHRVTPRRRGRHESGEW